MATSTRVPADPTVGGHHAHAWRLVAALCITSTVAYGTLYGRGPVQAGADRSRGRAERPDAAPGTTNTRTAVTRGQRCAARASDGWRLRAPNSLSVGVGASR
ncbi:hypothetical protein D7I43_32190 [Micromonospora globbae]|uniref:Uncharacterized protein n=1 Tax=Micromonospora globbae TaxID=1894969 RepID=A0A420EE84_9ACTN|nr:hypothetical protein D7I43_32190 [Micromonospora globbae]